MVTVYGVSRHHAGFGMYQRSAEGQIFPGIDSVTEYQMDMQSASVICRGLTMIDEGDDEYAQVEAADGNLYDQNGGTVIGWMDREGNVSLELVIVSE